MIEPSSQWTAEERIGVIDALCNGEIQSAGRRHEPSGLELVLIARIGLIAAESAEYLEKYREVVLRGKMPKQEQR